MKMLSKVHWVSVLIGILFAMFVLPMLTAFLHRGSSARTA